MRIKLHFLHSPDIRDFGAGGRPEDLDCFLALVQAFVAEDSEDAKIIGESFDFLVCTPRWLDREISERGHALGLFRIIVPRYDYQAIWDIIASICKQIDGDDWASIGSTLGKYGLYEFDPRWGRDPVKVLPALPGL